jgi:hypothetical protein
MCINQIEYINCTKHTWSSLFRRKIRIHSKTQKYFFFSRLSIKNTNKRRIIPRDKQRFYSSYILQKRNAKNKKKKNKRHNNFFFLNFSSLWPFIEKMNSLINTYTDIPKRKMKKSHWNTYTLTKYLRMSIV